jgi:formylglycine-generating enzyme required for sulfatase activity
VSVQADPRECPYVGLDPFQAAHAAYFFGRAQESKIIADHVAARPVTVLYGPSGVGKSSILNVGLPAALRQMADKWRAVRERRQREGEIVSSEAADWLVVRLNAWQDPEKLERLAIDAVLGELARRPVRGPERLRFAPLIAWITRRTGRPVLIILDQFEEYFLYRDRDRMQALEQAFANLIARRDLPVRVLIGLRDDALHQLDQLRAFAPDILDTMVELRGLSDAGIQEAIRGPMARYNDAYRKGAPAIAVEDALVATLVRQLKESSTHFRNIRAPAAAALVELPYLQLALIKLWAAEGGAAATALRESTLIDRIGGVVRMVRDHVNGVMETLDAKEQALCARMFDRLVTALGGKIAYPAAALATSEVVGPNVGQRQVEVVLNKLTGRDARILKPVLIDGALGFETFHDVLGLPVLEWKREFEAKEGEARLKQAARRRFNGMLALVCVLLATISALLVWFEHRYISEQYYRITQVRPYVLTAAAEPTLKPGDSFEECMAECPQMIVVPAGSFTMGSPILEPDHNPSAQPPHMVTIGRAFAVSKYELTFAQWDECVAYGDCPAIDDSGFGRGRQPLINVSWVDVQRYVAWFSKMTGKPYRLLTEAEYEYAARAGTLTEYPWGDDITLNGQTMAKCDGCGSTRDGNQPAPVGSFAPNRFGLYDMAGNIWEWVADCTHDNYVGAPTDGSAWTTADRGNCHYHIDRGGSWAGGLNLLRSAHRDRTPTVNVSDDLGFRVARTLDLP